MTYNCILYDCMQKKLNLNKESVRLKDYKEKNQIMSTLFKNLETKTLTTNDHFDDHIIGLDARVMLEKLSLFKDYSKSQKLFLGVINNMIKARIQKLPNKDIEVLINLKQRLLKNE